MQIWDLWIPDAGSVGVSFARGRLEQAEVLWVHSAPTLLRVEVQSDDGRRIAFGDNLERKEDAPMTLLRLRGTEVVRDEAWPAQGDAGGLVILPGGEVGILKSWWNDADRREWRWTVELYNHR